MTEIELHRNEIEYIKMGVEANAFLGNDKKLAERILKKLDEALTIPVVVVPKDTLCECNGNERVALDCTMKSCKHPKYFKG